MSKLYESDNKFQAIPLGNDNPKEVQMTKTKCLFFTVGIALAMAFTVSCSGDGSWLDGGSSSSEGNSLTYSYCLISGQCLSGPFTSKDCGDLGGLPSNTCNGGNPLSSSSGGGGSSSSGGDGGGQIVELTSPITADRTLKDLGLPIDYVYNGNNFLEVRNGAQLTIEPGVTIQFTHTGKNGGLNITDGAVIKAIGTASNRIRFIGAATKGSWRGIQLNTENANELEYVDVINAGSVDQNNYAAIYLWGARASIKNSLIDGSGNNGVALYGRSADLIAFSGNTVSNCGKAPIFTEDYVSGWELRNMDNTNTFTGNTNEYIHISETVSNAMETDFTLRHLNGYPWYFQGGLRLSDDRIVTIEPGAVILLGTNTRINVPGSSRLIAKGTAAVPITIRGLRDEAGYWDRINVESTTPGTVFEYCNISGGGRGTSQDNGLIFYWDNTYIEIYNTNLSKSLSSGVVCRYSSRTLNVHYNAFLKHSNVTFSEIGMSNFRIYEPTSVSSATMPDMANANASGWWQFD